MKQIAKNIFLPILGWMMSAAVMMAQPKEFSFRMLTPKSFVKVTANQATMRKAANPKAAKMSGVKVYSGEILPLVKTAGKWYGVEYPTKDKGNLLPWMPTSQGKLLKVAQLESPIMPPVYSIEGANGMAGCAIDGPDAQFVVRPEGIYSQLPFSVGHPSGSDNYTLQFLMAGINPSYTYVVTTSFVVTRVADKQASMSLVRDEENGKVVYEMLYMNVPRTVADDQLEAYVNDFLINSTDQEFGKLISSTFPEQGMVKNVTVFFKGTDGKRYSYAYDGSANTSSSNTIFRMNFQR